MSRAPELYTAVQQAHLLSALRSLLDTSLGYICTDKGNSTFL